MHRRTLGLLLVVLGAALFGTLGIFGRVAPEVGLSVTGLLAPRFLVATATLWGYLWVTGRIEWVRGRALAVELGLGVVYGIMSVAYFESLVWLSAGIAALLLFTYPVLVTVASAVVLDEPVTVPKLLALVAAVAGVVAVLYGGPVEIAPLGVVLVGLASLCYTCYTMGTRAVMANVNPLIHASYVFLGVSVTILAYGVATSSLSVPVTSDAWLLVAAITVVGTLLPMLLFTEGLVRVEASTASIVSTSEPLTTVALGVVLLGEPMTLSIALGAVLICTGVVLSSAAVERVIRRRLEGQLDNSSAT